MANLITITELAERIPYSVSHIRRLVNDGTIAAIQPAGKGGKLFFSTDTLDDMFSKPTVPCRISQKTRKLPGRKPTWKKQKEKNIHEKNNKKTEKVVCENFTWRIFVRKDNDVFYADGRFGRHDRGKPRSARGIDRKR